MIFIIILIYFVVLIIIELLSIILSNNKPKKYISFKNFDKNIDIKKEEIEFLESDSDLEFKNYVGKFSLLNTYGFFINLDKWNLIEENKLYNFLVPVNITVIKINSDNIKYYKSLSLNSI